MSAANIDSAMAAADSELQAVLSEKVPPSSVNETDSEDEIERVALRIPPRNNAPSQIVPHMQQPSVSVEECFEHQRWSFFGGWRPAGSMWPSAEDPPCFCAADVSALTSDALAAGAAQLLDPYDGSREMSTSMNPLGSDDPSSPNADEDVGTKRADWRPSAASGWRAVIGPDTDTDGWLYATSLSAITRPTELPIGEPMSQIMGGGRLREGGRASSRATDRVRRKLWIKKATSMPASSQSDPLPSSSSLSDSDIANTTAANAAMAAGAEEVVGDVVLEDRATAKQVFFEVLQRVGQRRGVWGTLGLLDGTAWLRTVLRDVEAYRAWLRKRVLDVVRIGGGGSWLVAYPAPSPGRAHSPGGTLRHHGSKSSGSTAKNNSEGKADSSKAGGAKGGSDTVNTSGQPASSPVLDHDNSRPTLTLPPPPSHLQAAEDLASELYGDKFMGLRLDDDDEGSSSKDSASPPLSGSSGNASTARSSVNQSIPEKLPPPPPLRGRAREPSPAIPLPQAARLHVNTQQSSPASPEALRELSCGALHACAAYGYPMAKGWLASVQAGATLLTWRRMSGVLNKVDAVRGVDDRTHSAAAVSIVGGLFEVLAANWRSVTFEPAWYLGADHALKWIVISVRGTLNGTDILTDLAAGDASYGNGYVHRGVLEAAHRVVAATQSSLDQARQQWPSYRVVCCGHSLGGGIASLVAALLRRGSNDGGDSGSSDRWRSGITSIAIGPLACVTADLVSDLDLGDFGTSVVLGMDPAPRLSVANVDRLLQDLNDATVVAYTARAAGSAMSAAMGLASLFHRTAGGDATTTVSVKVSPQHSEGGGKNTANENEDKSSADQDEVTAAAAVAIDSNAAGVAVAAHSRNNGMKELGSSMQAGISGDSAAIETRELDEDSCFSVHGGVGKSPEEIEEVNASKESGENEEGTEKGSKEMGHDDGTAIAAEEKEPASSSASFEHNASTERVMVPPGRLLHVDDEVADLLGCSAGAAPAVVAFEASPNDYTGKVGLSFSLMAYHLPQRYLAALLSAARAPKASPQHSSQHPSNGKSGEGGVGSKSASSDVPPTSSSSSPPQEQVKSELRPMISDIQFSVRFEHVASAFSMELRDPDGPRTEPGLPPSHGQGRLHFGNK